MFQSIEYILLTASLLLVVSIFASKVSEKVGVPVLLLFLGIGMLAGTDGIGHISFSDPGIAQFLGVTALIFILFSGGIDTRWSEMGPVIAPGVVLSTIGVLLTALVVGSFAYWVADLTWQEGLLLGAIVSSTDAAAVFSILRSRNMKLKGTLKPLLELESGSNDPMAYFLTIGMTSFITVEGFTMAEMIPDFFLQMLIGGIGGYTLGRSIVLLMNRVNLEFQGLYPVLLVGLVALVYVLISSIGGNGFLAVYITGLTIGNAKIIHKKNLVQFFDGVGWMMQIMMFITLGLLVFPQNILPVIGVGTLISLFLIFFARPIGVFISLLFFKYDFKEKLFVSWVGLRGAVPIVFAIYPLIAGVEKSPLIFNIVFFIVLSSVALQATTLPFVAKLLRLSTTERVKRRSIIDLEEDFKNVLVEIELPADSIVNGKKIFQLDFPDTCLVVLVNRGDRFITPNGLTKLRGGDRLMVMMPSEEEETRLKTSLGIND